MCKGSPTDCPCRFYIKRCLKLSLVYCTGIYLNTMSAMT